MDRKLRSPVGMGVGRVEELVAFQWAVEFKREVYRLVSDSPPARGDFRYRDQLADAAAGVEANIAEGFARFRPRECQAFFRYAIGSLAESRVRLKDGVDRGYFPDAEIDRADRLAHRCERALRTLAARHRRVHGLDT